MSIDATRRRSAARARTESDDRLEPEYPPVLAASTLTLVVFSFGCASQSASDPVNPGHPGGPGDPV